MLISYEYYYIKEKSKSINNCTASLRQTMSQVIAVWRNKQTIDYLSSETHLCPPLNPGQYHHVTPLTPHVSDQCSLCRGTRS